MNTIILIAIAVSFVLALTEVLREVLADRPSSTPPRSHYEDPGLRSPAAWG